MKKEIKRATQSFWRLLLLMVAFNSSLSLFAQTQTISGIVLDEFGEPMIGVSVLVKGTTTGIITDVEGNFTVPAKTGDVLLVKYLGYKDQEIKVTSDARLKITLHEDTQNLDEVVVVGYGTQKKVNLTGAVSAVTGEEIAKRPVACCKARCRVCVSLPIKVSQVANQFRSVYVVRVLIPVPVPIR